MNPPFNSVMGTFVTQNAIFLSVTITFYRRFFASAIYSLTVYNKGYKMIKYSQVNVIIQ